MAHTHSHASGDDNAKRLLLAFGVDHLNNHEGGGNAEGQQQAFSVVVAGGVGMRVCLLAVQFARRPPNARHTFGWLRLTTLAAFVNAIALVVITLLIVWEAIQRFRHPQPVAGMTMMAIAVAGLRAHLLGFWVFYRGRGEKNLNVDQYRKNRVDRRPAGVEDHQCGNNGSHRAQ